MALPGGRFLLAATALLFCAQCLHPHSQVRAHPSITCLPLLSLPCLVPVAIATADPLEEDHSVLVSDTENSDNDRDLPIESGSSLTLPSGTKDGRTQVLEDTSLEDTTTESLEVVVAADPSVPNATVTTEEAPLPKLSVAASSEDAPSVGEVVGNNSTSSHSSLRGRGPEEGGEEEEGHGEEIKPTPVATESAQPLDVVTGGEGVTLSLELTGTQELDGTHPPSHITSDDVPTPTPEGEGRDKDDDDVPTFEEFKQQKMIEQEAAKRNNNDVPALSVKRDKSNNYASIDCGAKVVAQNPEAQNPDAVLKENKDFYLLNPCSVDIWFVIEMCDLVAVHTIEIASFELFSSMPRDFGVYSSEGYPTSEWALIGEFRASDVRTVQTFPLTETVYAKYIKIEMLSHFGNDYYCPISLVRVLGASIMEEFQEAELRQATPPKAADESSTVATLSVSEDDELAFEGSDEKGARNSTSFLVKAKDVVLSILGHVNGLMNNGNGNEEKVTTDWNGITHEEMVNGNGNLDEVAANASESMSSPQEDNPGLSSEVEARETLVMVDTTHTVCTEGGEERDGGEHSSTVLPPDPPLQTAHSPERDNLVTSVSTSTGLPSEPLPSGHAGSAAPPGGGPQGGGTGVGGQQLEVEVASANEVQAKQEGVAKSTVDQVAAVTLGQLEISAASDVSVDGLVSSLESGRSDQPLPQPQVTDSGAGVIESTHAAVEDGALVTPEPAPKDGEEVGDEKHGQLEAPEGVGEGGGGEPVQHSPLSVAADTSANQGDTPPSEQEAEPVISPTPSTGDYGNGDVNSSSVGGGAGKSQQEKSVLIRLSNRVRDVEENMSLFTSYLDQLSTSMKKNKNKTEEINRKLTLLGEQLGDLWKETTHQSYVLRQVYKELRNLIDILQTQPSHRSQDPFPLLLQSMVVAGLTTVCVLLTAYLFCAKR